MKKLFIKASMLCLCAGMAFTSCSKKDDAASPASESQQTAGTDDTRAQNESDAGTNDAETAISSNSSTMRTSASTVDGATIDATNASSQKKLVINYDGMTNVGGRTRSGSITAQLTSGSSWTTQNAAITITYNNYKATRVSDGKSITINGSVVLKNTSGGLVTTMTVADTRTRSIRSSNLSITFDDNTQRTWSMAKKRTITCQGIGTAYTVKVSGDTTISSPSSHGDATHHVAAWGTTRFGTTFYTVIPDNDPVTWISANCTFVPASGSLSIEGLARTLTIKYGVDSNGAPVTTATCAYGVQLSWLDGSGSTTTAVEVY
ncbi:MAG: hypothetical protein JWO58_1938 [Chitinophagaceae bacterium]|nr:hypothetical protein [Chitinophagaceae bacterium]